MALTANLRLAASVVETGAVDFGSLVARADWLFERGIANGTAANQADLFWSDQRSVAASTNDDIDLVGALTRAVGGTFSPARIRGLFVKAAAANVPNLTLFGGTNPFLGPLAGTTPTFLLKPGAAFCWWDPAGIALTGASSDNLRVANGAGGASVYDILVIGASV